MKSLLLTLTALAIVSTASAGDVTGKITLTGTPKPESEIAIDPTCGTLRGAGKKMTTRFYVADATGGLADCVVYIEGAKGGAASDKPVVIDQVGCEYLPYINSAQVGQTIRVLNSDKAMHNVHPTPTVEGNPEANKAQLPGGAPLNFTFAKAEKFLRFKCDVHPWMFSYVSVFETPFHAVTGKDGSFKITGVPDGKYKLVVEHRKGGKVEKDIEVKGGAKADLSMAAK